MSFIDCIKSKRGSEIREEIADEAIELYKDLMPKNEQLNELSGMSQTDIQDKVLNVVKRLNQKKEFQDLQQIKKEQQAFEEVKNFRPEAKEVIKTPTLYERMKFGEGAIALITPDLGKVGDINSLETMIKTRRSEYMSEISELVVRSDVDFFNQRLEPDLIKKAMKRIIDGDSVNEKARAVANSLSKMFETMHRDYRLQGGTMGKLENFFVNPNHDPVAMRNVGMEQWIEDTLPKLDREKMTDYRTGEKFSDLPEDYAEARLMDVLRDVYKSNTRNGNYKQIPGTQRGTLLGNKRNSHRTLHFKNSKDWMDYQELYGQGTNPFEPVLKYIDGMTREISAMKRLGPKPKRTKRMLSEMILRKGDELGKHDVAKRDKKIFENIFESTMRRNQGLSGNTSWNQTLQSVSNVVRGSTIGSASLKAIPSDMGFSAIARSFNGMDISRNIMTSIKAFADQRKSIPQFSKLAQESGVISDIYRGHAISQMRFFGQQRGTDLTKLYNNQMMRKSMLEPWTIAARSAWGLEAARFFRDVSDLDWEELGGKESNLLGKLLGQNKGAFKEALEKRGVTGEDWEIFRQTPKHEELGMKIIRPVDVASEEMVEKTGKSMDELREIQHKIQNFIFSEQQMAVPSVTERAKATFEIDSGSPFINAAMKSIRMYSYFPITMMQMPMSRAIQHSNSTLRMATTGLITLTLMQGVGLQLEQLAKGKDPIDVTDFSGDTKEGLKFWANAMLQGGGLGMYENLLFRGADTPYISRSDAILGPDVSFVEDILNVGISGGKGISNVTGATEFENNNFMRSGTEFLQRWAPPGNLFYGRTLFDRVAYDNIFKLIDKDANEKFKKTIERPKESWDQEYYAPEPGEVDSFSDLLTETESPEFSKMFEDLANEGEQ